ncbi:caffeoylshikimate esterase-like isoform X2 [Magnolia sinica]|uniref:caffeoylshikimate esterase-like isoform X2 n=1 Tax=Magnolia sinica TaxID=86752 RepID=UPI002658B704|nr:caffeoylshikimate esterase-like isoform X2 [Magnolia sinica]
MELSFRHQPAKPLELFRKSDVPNAESKFRLIPISNSRGMNGRKPNLSISAARKAIDGLNDEMNAVASKNMDFAAARRQVRSAFIDFQQHLDHLLFKMAPSGIRTEESYEINSRGLEIFCKKWLPAEGVPMKGILCFCHGYGDTCTFFFEGIAKRFAAAGYGVYALDYPGFGLSEGLHGYIPSFDVLANDVIEHYTKVKGSPEGSGLPHFLLGQSMGGAVALKVHLKQPRAWDGVILVAPMCKAYYNVIAYSGRVRLKTAVELLKTTHEIEAQVEKVSSPLLVLHGAADKVTDPQISKFLHEKASSKDKTLKLYPEGYHSILEGEPDDRILKVIDDIISWLDSRCDLPKQ